MTAQRKSPTFDPLNPISILGFLNSFKLACDANGNHEGTAMWLFHFSINKSASKVLNARLSADHTNEKVSRKTTVKSKYLATYPQVVYFLLAKYATNEIIAETESAIT